MLGKAGALHPPDIWENAAGWCGYIDFIPLAGLSQVGTPPPEPLGACSGLGKRPWLWASTKYGAVRRDPPSPQWGKTPALCRQPSWKDFITAGIVSTWPSEPCPCLRRRPTPAQSLLARCEPSRGETSHQNPPEVDLGLLRGLLAY